MCFAFRTLNTLAGLGQHPTWPLAKRLLSLGLGLALLAGCHPLRRPWDPDPRLPASFESPRATFQTWAAAGAAGDRDRLAACYWEGLGESERSAYLAENLRDEARRLFATASWLSLTPVTPVEVGFEFESEQGQRFRGVMVRTGQGWKIQSW